MNEYFNKARTDLQNTTFETNIGTSRLMQDSVGKK